MELKPVLWMLKHQIKTSAGLPFEFTDHKFMIDPLNDMSPLQVLLKAPQIGATEGYIVKTLYCSKKKEWDIIYTLPTQSDVQDMAGGKINRIVAQNPIMLGWVKDHNTVEQKAVGDNIIYYRGTFSNKQAMMVSSDLNVHDELDASDPGVIEQYETRLQAKAGGRRWYFSHPSDTDTGVDVYWQQSDQKHWFITCPACKLEQFLSFPQSIDRATKSYVCKSCRAHLSDDVRRNGRWVARFENKPFSGYWISQLMCPWITAAKILDDFDNKSPQYFYNYVLGLPYSGGDSKLTQQMLFSNLTNERSQALENERVVIGIDTGLKITYVIGNQRLGLFGYNETDNYNELNSLMMRFPKAVAVIDAGGDMIGSREFFERWANRVFLCYTNSKFDGIEIWKWGDKEKSGEVDADRDKSIQLVVDEFRTRRIPLNGSEGDWWEYWLDWKNVSRIKITDPKTNQPKGIKWIRKGRDHWAMATVYWRIGVERFNESSTVTFTAAKGDSIGTPGVEVALDHTVSLPRQ